MYKFALKWYNFNHSFDELFDYGVNAGLFYPVDEDIWKIWYNYFKDIDCWEEAYRYINPDGYSLEVSYDHATAIERRRELHIALYYNARKEFKLLRSCEKRLTQLENKKS